jgi:hypothetical protein
MERQKPYYIQAALDRGDLAAVSRYSRMGNQAKARIKAERDRRKAQNEEHPRAVAADVEPQADAGRTTIVERDAQLHHWRHIIAMRAAGLDEHGDPLYT